MNQIEEGQVYVENVINENFQTLSHQAVYGFNPTTTSLLTWGYYEGRWGGFSVAAGTLTLADNTTNYVVVEVATGAITTSTANTNWLNTTDYVRVYKLTTAGAVVTVIEDHRAGPHGVHGGAGGSSGSGTVTSVAAGGGLQTASGSAITTTGTLQVAALTNAQTVTSYAILAASRAKRISFNNSAAIAANIAAAGSTGFEDGWFAFLECIGAGAVTLTPTTSTIDGSATLVLTTGMSAILFSDGTNYNAIVINRPGIPLNPQTGTSYTYLSGDRGKFIKHSNAAAIAGSLPAASGAFAGWHAFVKNVGAGTLTITPVSVNIDGASTLVLTTGQGALIVSDGSNYFTFGGATSGGGGGSLTYFAESASTSGVNGTRSVSALTAVATATDCDAVLTPKGAGALLANTPDGSAAGNKRGQYAVDWQLLRVANTQVAFGNYSAICGGLSNENNQTYGFIGGGQENVLVAGGSRSVICGGSQNSVTGSYGGILCGSSCTVADNYSQAGGIGCTSSGKYAFSFGYNNTADADLSSAWGRNAITRGVIGVWAHASGLRTATGDSQRRALVHRGTTTDATPLVITSDASSPSNNNQLNLPSNSVMKVRGQVVGYKAGVGDVAAWDVSAIIKNVGGTVSIVGTPSVTSAGADSGASSWTVSLTADNTFKVLNITVTGAASTTVYWVAELMSVEAA